MVGEILADTALQGLWHLEDVNDSSPNAYNLTNTNTVTFPSGKFRNSALFNGSNNYLTISGGSAANLKITGSRTISAWIKPATGFGSGGIFCGEDTTPSGYFIYLDSAGTVQFYCRGLTTNTVAINPIVLVAGNWYHVCGVYDSSNSLLKCWVNGVLEKVTASGSTGSTTGDFSIGSRDKGASVDLYFSGLIDEVAVYNRALSDKEVLDYYSWSLGRFTKVL